MSAGEGVWQATMSVRDFIYSGSNGGGGLLRNTVKRNDFTPPADTRRLKPGCAPSCTAHVLPVWANMLAGEREGLQRSLASQYASACTSSLTRWRLESSNCVWSTAEAQYLEVARTGRCTPPIVATPPMLSQARLSLFGPRLRELIRTTSVLPFGDMRPAKALAS